MFTIDIRIKEEVVHQRSRQWDYYDWPPAPHMALPGIFHSILLAHSRPGDVQRFVRSDGDGPVRPG